MLLSVSHIKKSFGDLSVLSDISFSIERGEHFALVGRNGSGKTTLLNIIAGVLSNDDGVVALEKDARIGYLPQYVDTVMEGSLFDYVLLSREDILSDEKKLSKMEDEMNTLSGEELSRHIEEYQTLSHLFELKGGPSYRSEVEGALIGLGFERSDFSRSTATLSGGQKTRLSLARILMGSPDLLILDEPINHLDLKSIEWLEGFLCAYKGAYLLVAHDRYFLNRVTDHVLSLYDEGGRTYRGNYQAFVSQRETELITNQRAVEKQQHEIAHQEAVIKKLQQFNREKSIKRAESRKKLLDKVEIITKLSEEGVMRPLFSSHIESGKDVLSVNLLQKAFDEHVLYEGLSFEIKRGERVALIGDNGTGKTTLIKQLLSYLDDPDNPFVRLGTNVEIGYFDQEQKLLSPEKTIMEEVHDRYPSMTELSVRQALSAFSFTGDDINERIGQLSGGERARVSLTSLMLSHDNFLILDEPTNHLDMESKEALEDALSLFDGTILFVSHDRYFVNSVATRILELYNGRLIEYLGDYDYYLKKRDEFHITFALEDETVSKENAKNTASKEAFSKSKEEKARKQKNERLLKKTEEEIEALEKSLKEIESEFEKPENMTNSLLLTELSKKQEEIKATLEGLYLEWERLSEV